jgi:hypothetical protein
MKTLLCWAAVFCVGFAAAHADTVDAIPTEKSIITLTPKFGPVTFNHERHSQLEGVDCVTCHHTMGSDSGSIRSCYSCHEARYFSIANIKKAGPDEDGESESTVPDAQQAFHDLCTGCHEQNRKRELPAGPDDSCRDCHK